MYDEETGLYYLRSRYYNPEWGRFLNADDTEKKKKSESIFSYNLYEYCDANSISRIDYDGKWSLGIAMEGVSACAATFGGSFVIGALGAAGGSNFWNPFGWICLGVAAAAICVGAIVYAKKHSAVNSTETKTLSDVKVRQPVGQHYQLAYVNSYGALVRVGPKLSFVDALGMLGITGASNSLSRRYTYNRGQSSPAQRLLEKEAKGHWGIYADSQQAAKALAIVLGYSGRPEVHSSGMYGHYHDLTHTFHI